MILMPEIGQKFQKENPRKVVGEGLTPVQSDLTSLLPILLIPLNMGPWT